jgi:phosphate acyltransferase
MGLKPIAIDAMGGDHAPKAIVEGAKAAFNTGVPVVLVGPKERLAGLAGNIPIVEATEYITMEDAATDVRKKKDASINICMQLLKKGEASAVVAMGHTGATLAAALFGLGRMPGVDRPTLLVELPSDKGKTFLSDGGANLDCKPAWLVQFAYMATVYAEASGVTNPSVGLLNIGEEEGKGNQLALETYPLLQEAQGIRFLGNVEGRDVFKTTTDIVIADGFTGNVVLKLSEGEAKIIFKWVREALTSSALAKLGALLVRPALQALRAKMDPAEYGAMPLLGVEGAVFIGHGSADARAVENAIYKAKHMVEAGLVDRLRQKLALVAGADAKSK